MSNYSDNVVASDSNHVWNKISRFITENSQVLDVGCSSGNLGSELIKTKHCVVDGIEIDTADAAKAKTKLRNVWVLNAEDSKQLDAIKEKYDAIIFADVIEHLVDPAIVLKNVVKLLKPGGRIVFSIPNMAHVSVRLALLAGEFDHTDTGLIDRTHLHFYTEAEIRRVVAKAGLELTSFDASSYAYPKEIIDRKLQTLGLKPTAETYKLLQAPDAAAFQFVGVIEPTKKTAGKKPNTRLATEQPIHRDIKEMVQAMKEKEKEVYDKEVHIQNLTRELEQLKSSKVYKLVKTIRR